MSTSASVMALFDVDDGPVASPYAVELQALEDYRHFSATTIARFYRGWICRTRLKRQRAAQQQRQQAEAAAAQSGQQLYTAARRIQDAWRAFNNRRIFRYYRDLIRFREAGDPRQMLRCINAREAGLIDAAAGLHIRFRLGGSRFPPLILYKIFTRRPVTDIGAFGPRNYAAEAAALTTANTAAMLHNKPDAAGSSVRQQAQQQQQEFELPARLREFVRPDGSLGYRSTRGWYRREDRNGWRPVADRLLLEPEQQAALPAAGSNSSSGGHMQHRRRRRIRCRQQQQPPPTDCSGCGGGEQQQGRVVERDGSFGEGSSSGSGGGGSSGRTSPEFYHHSPIVRRQDRARRLKQRRRHWLLKMYRAGMQQAGAGGAAAATGGSSSSIAQAGDDPKAAAAASRVAASSRRRSAAGGDAAAEELLLQQLERRLLLPTGAGSGDESDDGDETDEGWQVDELVALGLDAGLLAWSERLDFDSYQREWYSCAVTAGSEALLPESERTRVVQMVAEWGAAQEGKAS